MCTRRCCTSAPNRRSDCNSRSWTRPCKGRGMCRSSRSGCPGSSRVCRRCLRCRMNRLSRQHRYRPCPRNRCPRIRLSRQRRCRSCPRIRLSRQHRCRCCQETRPIRCLPCLRRYGCCRNRFRWSCNTNGPYLRHDTDAPDTIRGSIRDRSWNCRPNRKRRPHRMNRRCPCIRPRHSGWRTGAARNRSRWCGRRRRCDRFRSRSGICLRAGKSGQAIRRPSSRYPRLRNRNPRRRLPRG